MFISGYDKGRASPIYLDRLRSGNVDFNPSFSKRATATRELFSDTMEFQIVLDVSAIEVYVDGGLTCMTALFYPDEYYTKFEVRHHAANEDQGVLAISSGFVGALYSMDEVPRK
jgi:fructan beta-fructosidase